jgi:hypothetical protein
MTDEGKKPEGKKIGELFGFPIYETDKLPDFNHGEPIILESLDDWVKRVIQRRRVLREQAERN